MNVIIETSDPEAVDPAEIAKAIEAVGYLVLAVEVHGRQDGSVKVWEVA